MRNRGGRRWTRAARFYRAPAHVRTARDWPATAPHRLCMRSRDARCVFARTDCASRPRFALAAVLVTLALALGRVRARAAMSARARMREVDARDRRAACSRSPAASAHGLVDVRRPYDGGLVFVADVGGFSAGPYRFVIHDDANLHVAERVLRRDRRSRRPGDQDRRSIVPAIACGTRARRRCRRASRASRLTGPDGRRRQVGRACTRASPVRSTPRPACPTTGSRAA